MKTLIVDDCQWLFAALGVHSDKPDYPGFSPESYQSSTHQTLGCWFAQICLPKLTMEDCRNVGLFLINSNFKFRPDAKRTDCHGISILQHIRLTKLLPEATRRAHIVLYSFQTGRMLQEREPTNLVIHSPGVTLLRLPEEVEKLKDPNQWDRWSDEKRIDLCDLRQTRLFYLETDDVLGRQYAHSFRNRAGVAKFLTEFAGDVIKPAHPVLKDLFELETSDLEYKCLLFRYPALEGTGVPNSTVTTKFRDATRHSRYLYIDDEHMRGWSLGLYSGLTGKVPEPETEDYQLLRGSQDFTTSDEVLRVIGNFEFAEAFLNAARGKIQTHLEQLEKAWEEFQRRGWKCEEARREQDKSTTQVRFLEGQVASLQKAHEEAGHRLEEARSELYDVLTRTKDAAFDVATRAESASGLLQGDEALSRQMRAMGSLSAERDTKQTAYNNALMQVTQAERAMREGEVELEKKKAEDLKLKEHWSPLFEALEDAKREIKHAENELADAFPFGVIFLDLRLRREDERAQHDQLSGWTILKQLKESFPHIPVVLFTASEKALNSETASKLGAAGYWIKGLSSGQELREIVAQCLRRSAFKSRWIQLCELARKPRLMCKVKIENRTGGCAYDLRGMHADIKRDTIALLWDSFWLLWQNTEPDDRKVAVWDAVIRNVGIVQTMRYQGFEGPDWGANESTPRENEFRLLRNRVTHPGASGARGRGLEHANRQQASDFFDYTIRWLLKVNSTQDFEEFRGQAGGEVARPVA